MPSMSNTPTAGREPAGPQSSQWPPLLLSRPQSERPYPDSDSSLAMKATFFPALAWLFCRLSGDTAAARIALSGDVACIDVRRFIYSALDRETFVPTILIRPPIPHLPVPHPPSLRRRFASRGRLLGLPE